METIKPSLLIADDEEDVLTLYKNLLKKKYQLTFAKNGREATELFSKNKFDTVILDVIMPEMNGTEALKSIKSLDPSVEVIMVTASKEIKPAVESLKLGAFDYIIKPFEIDDLTSTIEKALERKALLMENIYLKQALDERASFGELIGKSIAMKRIYDVIDGITASDCTVIITGESGTGKEVVASTIHKKSKRSNRPYIIVNCAAIPDNLLESSMFGHEKGSFTGALDRHIGKFELANGGTIFLDEIGELSPAMQAKLLRVLQEGTIERVGGNSPIPIDVRVIAATNIDITSALKEKRFREDLFYRLNVIPVHIPPLRERKEDFSLLLDHFIIIHSKELNKTIKGMTEKAKKLLMGYDWPGNIRELTNIVERMVTLTQTKELDIKDIPIDLGGSPTTMNETLSDNGLDEDIRSIEKRLIRNALISCNGNQTLAAKKLKVHRTTLISKMESLGLKSTS